jgi:hypothetical protein
MAEVSMTPEQRLRDARESVVIAASSRLGMPGVQVSWGGVWAGFLVGIGVLMLLNALGLAIGISIIDLNAAPGVTGDAQAWSIGAAAWLFLSVLISLFVAGMVSSRAGQTLTPGTGAIQGTVVWVLAMLGMMLFGAAGMSLGSNALLGSRAIAPVVGRAAPGLGAGLANGDLDQVVGRLSDPGTADRIAAATGMARDDVAARLADIRGRVEAHRNDPPRALAEARQGLQELTLQAGATAARPYATLTSWVTFGVMLVSLLAAVLGGRLGARGAALA